MALFLGSLPEFCNEISRVTLFFPQNSVSGASVFGVLPTLLCGCLTKPFFIFRPSTFWCVCIKHLVPFVMLIAIVDGKQNLPAVAAGCACGWSTSWSHLRRFLTVGMRRRIHRDSFSAFFMLPPGCVCSITVLRHKMDFDVSVTKYEEFWRSDFGDGRSVSVPDASYPQGESSRPTRAQSSSNFVFNSPHNILCLVGCGPRGYPVASRSCALRHLRSWHPL